MVSATCPRARDGVADDGSRWWCPVPWHGFDAVTQNGSAASELAADAYHWIMVWVFRPAAYKDVGTIFVHTNPQLPSDFVIPTRSSVPSCAKPSKDEAFGGAQTRAILDRFCARRALDRVGR